MAPTISVKINGEWVPISTLTEGEWVPTGILSEPKLDEIKQRVADRLGIGINRQIAIMSTSKAAHATTA